VDYFQDMEPTYVRPTIIQKTTISSSTNKPQQTGSRLAMDASWVHAPAVF